MESLVIFLGLQILRYRCGTFCHLPLSRTECFLIETIPLQPYQKLSISVTIAGMFWLVHANRERQKIMRKLKKKQYREMCRMSKVTIRLL